MGDEWKQVEWKEAHKRKAADKQDRMRLQSSCVEVTAVERENKEGGSHDRGGCCRADDDLAGADASQKSSLKTSLSPVRTHPPPHLRRALALPFIKSRPLVPKKFENPKKPHIAPSQRLVAKVHPSYTSLSKGLLFFLSQRKRCAYTVSALAQHLSSTLRIDICLYTPGRCESCSTRRTFSRISKNSSRRTSGFCI
jgi:hypothetical protein